MKERHPDCTVLVASCDKYADLLHPFSILWKKYWPDCPFETVLVTESQPADDLCFFSKRGLPPFKTRLIEGIKAIIFRCVPTTLLVRVQNALGAGAKEKPSTGGR